MSSRALRKLKGGRAQEELGGPAVDEEVEDEVEDEVEETGAADSNRGFGAHPVNRFCLLGEEEEEEVDGHEEGGGENRSHTQTPGATEEGSLALRGGAKKVRRRKKRAVKETKEQAVSTSSSSSSPPWEAAGRNGGADDDGEHPPSSRGQPQPCGAPHGHRQLLNVEHRHLNPDNELKRFFGARAVMGDANRRRRRHNQPCRRHTWLTVPKDTWPRPGRTGIGMELVESRGGLHFFRFVHSRDYQRVQNAFLDAVDSMDPHNLVALTHTSPYHVDSLLQLSDVCRLQDDHEMAREFVERALFCLESSFHPLFSLTSGSCRLDYRYPENRSLYLALFKHLAALEKRGCSRTALELAKLILSLAPDEDPLGVLLLIDHLCLRAREYRYLTHFYRQLEPSKNLSQLPNMAFSVALAWHHLEVEEVEARVEEEVEEVEGGREARGGGHEAGGGSHGSTPSKADELLQEALLAFPSALMLLLGKCGVEPTPEVAQHPYLGTMASRGDPPALQELTWLFVERAATEWRSPPVVLWLEWRVARLVAALDSDPQLARQAASRRKVCYRGSPRNVHRHVVLSEAKEATAHLPPEVTNSPILGYDPLPPLDSIVSYTRPERPPAPAGGGTLSLFFRSLLPSFNMRQGALGADDDGADAGAEGAEGGGDGGREVGRGITQLLAAMRELLANIRFDDDGGRAGGGVGGAGDPDDPDDPGHQEEEWD
uniref:Transcription factor 25 isoform X2 n=1 Tax=Petromyzon marinus TaxID=7757 RepID=A0AAJ7UHS1_PETMA|nr:transcription factor 25 isoform X2 [Petromyzon marinus]